VGEAHRRQTRAQMDDDDRRAFKEKWEYRAAVRRFQSAFEAAERLAEAERALLLKEVASWLLQNLPNVISEERETARVVGVEIEIGRPDAGRHDDPPEAA